MHDEWRTANEIECERVARWAVKALFVCAAVIVLVTAAVADTWQAVSADAYAYRVDETGTTIKVPFKVGDVIDESEPEGWFGMDGQPAAWKKTAVLGPPPGALAAVGAAVAMRVAL
jgi:hypothetical protein